MAQLPTNLVAIMSKFDREILEKNREHIRDILAVDDVLDHLVDTKILDNRDCDILRDNKRKAPDLLVDLLLNNRTSAALIEFTTALEKAGRYDTLLFMLRRLRPGLQSSSDIDEEEDHNSSKKTEKFYQKTIRKQSQQIDKLKEQLKKARQEKESLQRTVAELAKSAGKKDKKIKELKTHIEEHENRIKELEDQLTRGSKKYDERFAEYGEQIGALTERLNNLDTNRPVYVGNVGTTIQTHVHNDEDAGQVSHTRSRQLPHLQRSTAVPTPTSTPSRTPRSAISKKKH